MPGPRLKTVYVLGAGFSRNANIPLQSEILPRIAQKEIVEPNLRRIFEVFSPSATSLEDLFTLCDQAIIEKQYSLGLTWLQIARANETFLKMIVGIIQERLWNIRDYNSSIYSQIALYFVRQRLLAGQRNENTVIISLNWDSLLENAIYYCINRADLVGSVDVDYGCLSTPLGNSPHVSSLIQNARRIFNIKILKPHGSANWLLCPCCNRLYTALGSRTESAYTYIMNTECHECRAVFNHSHDATLTPPYLKNMFITPTFLKEFNNPHIKLIWHNCFISLAEADEVIFIGYSLPRADYHLRTLFKRAINNNARITVVLASRDRPARNASAYIRDFYAGHRYQEFFEGRHIDISYSGVRNYFMNVM